MFVLTWTCLRCHYALASLANHTFRDKHPKRKRNNDVLHAAEKADTERKAMSGETGGEQKLHGMTKETAKEDGKLRTAKAFASDTRFL